MASPLIVRSNYGDLFTSSMLPVLEEMFTHNLALHPSIREMFCNVKRTQRDIWQASEMGDFQNFVETPEGIDYTLVRQRAGANKTLVPKKYGLGFSISEEIVEDGKFDFIADAVKKLAESAIDSREQSAIDLINNAYSSVTSWDGQTLFASAHTLPSGLTFRNQLASASDLSQSALDTMISDFETQFIRDSGKLAMIKPKYLLVHPSQRRYAKELVGSDLKADTADNNMNSIRDEGLVVISSARLADPDSWQLLSAPIDNGLQIIERKGIETKAAGPDLGFMNDSIVYKSRYREIVGVTHPYGVFGSGT